MKTSKHIFIVSASHAGTRLDMFLSKKLAVSRSQVQKLIRAGQAYINGHAVTKGSTTLSEKMRISIRAAKKAAEQTHKKTRTKIPDAFKHISVIAETEDFVVVYKPAGILVHPTFADESHTLAHWVKKKYPDITTVGEKPDLRPGMVHRLDKETSGLLVVARTNEMYVMLKAAFKERRVEKYYTALVYGSIEKDHDMLVFPIDRGKDGRMVARPHMKTISLKTVSALRPGKQAVTEFFVTKRFARYTLLDIRLHTGRTHQIRVHLYAYDHPVVGDVLYAQKKWQKKSGIPLDRLFLHAGRLCFPSRDGEMQCFEVPLPKELTDYLLHLS